MAEYNSVNLGRIMPKYTGDYSTNVNYNTLDIVFYEGNSYIATQPSLRQTPAIDSEYWGLISSKGDKGDKGDTGPAGKDAPSNDAQLVHNTGNETVAGDKTFTGTLVANNPITGTLSIAMLPQKDLNSATDTGKYKINNTYSNTPIQMPNGAFIDVLNFDNNLIYQVIVARDISDTLHMSTMWVRIRISDSWGNWQSISKDDNVLHNFGNETVAGDKTFTGNTTLATTTILAGNYGLRVTPSGFQKTTDGKTWVSANI